MSFVHYMDVKLVMKIKIFVHESTSMAKLSVKFPVNALLPFIKMHALLRIEVWYI